MTELTHLEKRRIQMEYAVPLVKDLQDILGQEVVLQALAERNRRNESMAARERKPDFARMEQGTKVFAAGGALDYRIITATESEFDMNVTGCRYAEMMTELGGREFGHLLICDGDFAAASAIGMTLERTQTRMQGAEFCDFRYRAAENEPGKKTDRS